MLVKRNLRNSATESSPPSTSSVIPLFLCYKISLLLSLVRELFSSKFIMNTIVNFLPIRKRWQTRKNVNCTDALIPRTIFQYKNKTVITEEDFQIGLQVIVHRVEGLDKFADYPCVKNGHYNVVYWIKPGEEIHTKFVEGVVTPEWDQDYDFVLESLDDQEFLNVEVQRFNSFDDPGTSSGKVVIGRAKIPLPMEFNRRKSESFPLLRSDEKGQRLEGKIALSMKLYRIMPYSSSDSWPF